MTPERKVPTRRMSFEQSLAAVPRHYAGGGNVVMSHAWSSMSAVFPDGEEFFVRSVRHFRDRIDDPVLKRQVAGFIGQEAMHGREHRVFNDRLDEVGYPVKKLERLTRKGLALRERIFSPHANLAMTVALEHVTALLAEAILTDQPSRDLLGDPAVRDLFLWHALEESEHKAVAFDVYRAVGGSERTRVWTMRFLRHGLLLGALLQIAVAFTVERDRRAIRDGVRAARRTALFSRTMWRAMKDFERPGFHPDDRDTTALLAEWRERLFGADGELNDRLVGAA